MASFEDHHLTFLGEESLRAAGAAECALQQALCWEYHDVLLQKQRSDGRENMGVYSPENLKRSGASWPRLGARLIRRVRSTPPHSARASIRARHREGAASECDRRRARAAILPTFLVNDRIVAGAQPIEVCRQVIAQALAGRLPVRLFRLDLLLALALTGTGIAAFPSWVALDAEQVPCAHWAIAVPCSVRRTPRSWRVPVAVLGLGLHLAELIAIAIRRWRGGV